MNDTLDSAQKSRREFLEKAGKLAVYTPPVIMMLSYPGTEAIASGGPPGPHPGPHPGPGPRPRPRR